MKKKPTGKPEPKSTGKTRKAKQPTQKTPQQRILVIDKNGKRVMKWRDWPAK